MYVRTCVYQPRKRKEGREAREEGMDRWCDGKLKGMKDGGIIQGGRGMEGWREEEGKIE